MTDKGAQRRCCFDQFLVFGVREGAAGEKEPFVKWRFNASSTYCSAGSPSSTGVDVDDAEVAKFCFPYPERTFRTTARTRPEAEEFVFVLSKAKNDESQVWRTIASERRCVHSSLS